MTRTIALALAAAAFGSTAIAGGLESVAPMPEPVMVAPAAPGSGLGSTAVVAGVGGLLVAGALIAALNDDDDDSVATTTGSDD